MTLTYSMVAIATLACITTPSFASAAFTTGSPGQFGSVAVYGTTANGMIGVCSLDILRWRGNDRSWQRSSVPCRR
jgi:hypothetical protein